MKTCLFMNGHLLVLEIDVEFFLRWKSQVKFLLKMHTNKFVHIIENLRASVNKKNQIGKLQTRVCANCGEEKPLDKDHYQVIKSFKSGFSYYCNVCNAPKKRD